MFKLVTMIVFMALPTTPFMLNAFPATTRLIRLEAAKDEQSESKRRPWDVGRFARTAVFFDAFPNPLKRVAQALGGIPSTSPTTLAPGTVIWKPGNNPYGIVWGPLDDVVMGGSSQSEFSAENGTWSGDVITAGGGFAGLRTKLFEPPLDLSQCRGLRLKLHGGDGKRFKFIVRDDTDW